MTTNTGEVRALIDSWAAAVRAGDRRGIEAHHADDIVMYDVPEPLELRGIDAYRGSWNLFFRYSPGGDGSFDIVDLEIHAGDTVAFAFGLLRIGGEREPRCRLTIGLRKRHGKWWIVHEHHSAPHPLEQS